METGTLVLMAGGAVALIFTLAIIVAMALGRKRRPDDEAAMHVNLSDAELEALRDAAVRVPGLEMKIETLEASLSETKAAETSLREQNTALEVAKAELHKEREAQENIATNLKGELRAKEAAFSKMAASIESLNAEKLSLESEVAGLKNDIRHKDERYAESVEQKETLAAQMDELQRRIESLTESAAQAREERTRLEAKLSAQKDLHRQLMEDFEEKKKQLELSLGEIMQRTLDSKIKKFDETSTKQLGSILKPFRENLDEFKKRIETQHKDGLEKFASLSKEIELVTKTGMMMSEETHNLTQALKGKKQTQGSWGEMILETVLEYSGLIKGTHYETQSGYRDEQGEQKRPDVVIRLPKERTMIIDSKVSLVDYDHYIRAESDEERNIAAQDIAKAFKKHVDILDSKDYAHYKVGTLQYVFMFVPVEGAFSIAVQTDPHLYEYALKKHIAIVNPSTLTVSLRTIYLHWQSEQSNTLAAKLFEEAGKLYDKMVGFADTFRKAHNQLQTVQGTFAQAEKQLTDGSGNILGRFDKIKHYGARASKSMKDSKLEYQDFTPDVIEPPEVEVIEAEQPAPSLSLDEDGLKET